MGNQSEPLAELHHNPRRRLVLLDHRLSAQIHYLCVVTCPEEIHYGSDVRLFSFLILNRRLKLFGQRSRSGSNGAY